MNTKIIAGKSILENTNTKTIFIADKLTEETQCKGDNRNHIEKVGDLDISVLSEKEQINKFIQFVAEAGGQVDFEQCNYWGLTYLERIQ